MWGEVENMNPNMQEHMSKDVKVALWAALLTAVAKMLEGKTQSIRVAFDLSGAYPVPGKDRKVSRKAVRAAVNRWLKAGRAPEAETVFWEDLKRNPKNGWALYGLQQSLKAQGKNEQAAAIEKRFREAWVDADVDLTKSPVSPFASPSPNTKARTE